MMISKEDHNSGRINQKEFHRRLAFCSKNLREAKLCLRGGFTPLEEYMAEKEKEGGKPSEKDKVGRLPITKELLERAKKQEIKVES